jgi:hypothetical protein
MTPLDGHINRCLEGKRISRALKDGRFLILEMDNGEQFNIAWANANTGEGIEGEPCLVRVNVSIAVPGASMFGAANV